MDEGDVELAAAAAAIVKAKGRRIVNGSRRMREKGIANRYSLVLVESNCYCLHDVWDDGCVLDFDIISRGAKSELLLPLRWPSGEGLFVPKARLTALRMVCSSPGRDEMKELRGRCP